LRTLLAFRHAEATINRPDLYMPGHADWMYPLTDAGLIQAQAAGRWVHNTFDWVKEGNFHAATSQFVRAQQTYQGMGLPQVPLFSLLGLNEQDWGDFMGSSPPEHLRASFDTDYEIRIDATAPHGESTLDLFWRVRSSLSQLAADETNNLLLVTHGRALIVLRMIIEGIPPTDAGWQYMRQKTVELPNCGALYYPDFHLPLGGASRAEVRMAIAVPPYGSMENLLWRPFIGEAFDALGPGWSSGRGV